MIKDRVKISSFLTEREDRFKPDAANKLGLKRVNKIDFSGEIHLVDHKPTRTNMILVKKGDLLISGINAEKGAIAVYEYEEDAIATIHYSSYSYDDQQIDIEYLKWFLKSNVFKNILIEQAGNGIKSELKAKKFLKLEIDLPQLRDQIEFVSKMASVNQEIEELNNLIQENESLLSQLRQSILQDAIQGKLTVEWRKQIPDIEPASKLLKRIKSEKEQLIKEKKIKREKPLPKIKADEFPFEIPESWEWCWFQEIATIESNLVKPEMYPNYPHVAPDSIEKGTGKLLAYRTVEEDKLISSKHLFYPNHILYSKIRPHLNKLVMVDFEGLCSADMYPVKSYISIKFLFRYMLSTAFLEQSKKVEGRVAMPKINQTELNKILVPIPPMEEQEIIISKVEYSFNEVNKVDEVFQQTKNKGELLLNAVLSELLGEENMLIEVPRKEKKISTPIREIKYDSKTTLMELVALLKKHGRLNAEDLWKMSKFPEDIDQFYAELKKQIEQEKAIKESAEKGYLELA